MSKDRKKFGQDAVQDITLEGILDTIQRLEQKFPEIEGSLLRALLVEALHNTQLKANNMGTAVIFKPYESQILK